MGDEELAGAAAILGLSTPDRDLLGALRDGVALWRIGSRAFVVEHKRSSAETDLFSTDTRMTG